MSIQRVPYPPYVKIDDSDVLLREMIATFAVTVFVIPLCIEANYASQEKFIGVTVSVSYNFLLACFTCFFNVNKLNKY